MDPLPPPLADALPRTRAVVIGASAGAVEALTVLLPVLPRTLRVPVIVVVHLPPDRESALPALFQGRCALTVKEAEDKEELAAGVVYFAPPNYHLLVEPSREFAPEPYPGVIARPNCETPEAADGCSLESVTA